MVLGGTDISYRSLDLNGVGLENKLEKLGMRNGQGL
jgi:hypothetical protein